MPDQGLLEAGVVAPKRSELTLRNKVVVVTGGAGRLGAATAEVLGVAGAKVVLADLDLPRAQHRTAELAAIDVESLAFSLDVGDEGQVRRLIRNVHERFGRLDAIINNAAMDIAAPISELQGGGWERVVRTNLTGPFLMIKHALEVMKPGGQIVNIISTAPQRVWPNASAYHATKWGLLGLSYSLHAELQPRGIKVAAIVTGGMRAPFLADRSALIDPGVSQDPMNVARAILRVLSQPEDGLVPEEQWRHR